MAEESKKEKKEIRDKTEKGQPPLSPIAGSPVEPLESIYPSDIANDPVFRRLIPPATTLVGRSVKLRNLFTLSGVVKSSSTPVTVVGSTVGTTETDLNSFRFFKDEFHVGMIIRISALGTYTSDGTRTMTLRVGLGTAPVTEWNSAISTAASTTDAPWNLVWYGIITSIGSAGTLEAQLTAKINNVNKDDANNAAVAFNTQLNNTIGLTVQWSANNSGNSVTCRQFIVEILN